MNKPSDNSSYKYTYYLRDAQGNVLAKYSRLISKQVNYNNITYNDLNNKIINLTSNESFAWYISNLHSNGSQVSNDLANALYISIIPNTTSRSSFLYNSNINPYNFLIHENNSQIKDNVISNVSNTFFIKALRDNGMANINQLCLCMDNRNKLNNTYLTLQDYTINNSITRASILYYLYKNDQNTYNSILNDIGISVSGTFAQDILQIEQLISHDGTNSLRNSLNNFINFSDCNGILSNIFNDLLQNDNDFINAIGNIPDLKQLYCSSSTFSCELPNLNQIENIILALTNYDPAIMLQLAVDNSSESYVIGWYKDYDIYEFLYYSARLSNSTVSDYQDYPNRRLYSNSGNGIRQYFDLIKSQFGTSLYDQLISYYSSQSNLYVDQLKLSEWHIYGSSRLGIYQTDNLIASREVQHDGNCNDITLSDYENTNSSVITTPLSFSNFSLYRGAKHYELSNHLGNVLSVISDKKTQNCTNGLVTSYQADVVSANDYSPFGAPMTDRKYEGIGYRYGFNGMEKDNEAIEGIYTTYFREIDVRLSRFWKIDPAVKAWESPYVFGYNSPLFFSDPLGDDPPQRLSLWSRINNFMKGDGYKNSANKYAVDNKIDETNIYSGYSVKTNTNFISIKMPFNQSMGAGAHEKMFYDGDPIEGNKFDWAGNCPFKIGGLGYDYSTGANANLALLSGNFTVSNSSRGYGRSENGKDFANMTTVSIEGRNQFSKMLDIISKPATPEHFGYIFITSKPSLNSTIFTPKLYNKQTFQLFFIKAQYKSSMNINGTGQNWEFKIGATSSLEPVDYINSTGIEMQITNVTTE